MIATRKGGNTMEDPQKLTVLSTYIDGKMKRYGLLFSVNGGAFAIAKLHSSGDDILGDLDMRSLALGAILFTEAMTVDIWAWGERMKRNFSNPNNMVFTAVGKIIVLLLASLLILAWGRAAELTWGCIGVLFLPLVAATTLAHWRIGVDARGQK
jgi:hypothetical protein